MWEKASFSSAEFLTRTVKNTHEKTCNNTCCISEGGVVGAWIQIYGLFLAWLWSLWSRFGSVCGLGRTYSCCCCLK